MTAAQYSAIPGLSGSRLFQWSYDVADRVATATYPNNEVLTYTYDAAWRTTSMATSMGGYYVNNVQFNLDGQGHLANTQQQLGNGLYQRQNYTGVLSRLGSLTVGTTSGGVDRLNQAFTYDPVGNIKTVSDVIAAGQTNAGTQTFTCGYDFLNRLTSAIATNRGSDPGFNETYSYDAIGNLTAKAGVSYTYPTAGSARPHTPTVVGTDPATKNYSYDANGNLLQGGGRSYTWGVDNQPTGIIPAGGTVFAGESYTYGPDGERLSRTRAGITTYYFGLWEEEYGGSGGTIKRAQYKWGGGVIAQREMIGSDTIGTMTYLHSDHLGSVSVATNGTGGYVDASKPQQGYDPWGKVRLGSIGQTTLNYTGQKLDGTGLLFYNARYYDPGVGKFTSADTISSGGPQGLNRYSYVNNNPIMLTDPSGHCAKKDNGTRDYDADKGCWDAYAKAKAAVGDRSGLDNWNEGQLNNLLAWVNRGVKFDKGSNWTGTSINRVMEGLNRIFNAFFQHLGKSVSAAYSALDTMLGIGSGKYLTFALSNTDSRLAFIDGSKNTISLNEGAYNDPSTDSSGIAGKRQNEMIETVIHELGHLLDYRASKTKAADLWWSSTGGQWQPNLGWQYISGAGWVAKDGETATGYGSTNPWEDFAESFTWWVAGNGGSSTNGRDLRRPSNNRLSMISSVVSMCLTSVSCGGN